MASISRSFAEDEQYFRFPRLPWLIVIPPGLAFMTAAALKPDSIPDLGRISKSVQEHPDLVYKIFVTTWTLHGLEALYAFYFARRKNISFGWSLAWFAQTFIYGIASLRPLFRHFKRNTKKKNQTEMTLRKVCTTNYQLCIPT